jgi:hypothetical protein
MIQIYTKLLQENCLSILVLPRAIGSWLYRSKVRSLQVVRLLEMLKAVWCGDYGVLRVKARSGIRCYKWVGRSEMQCSKTVGDR